MNISEEVGYLLRAGRTQSIAYTLRENGRNTSQGLGNYVLSRSVSTSLSSPAHAS